MRSDVRSSVIAWPPAGKVICRPGRGDGLAGGGGILASMPFEAPRPDPSKILAFWMEWERGEQTPGRTIANLKTAGLRELLDSLVVDPE